MDQYKLHDPTRACENKVFFVTANKVGSLLPAELLQEQLSKEQNSQLSIEAFITPEDLVGIGQSQIIAPDGKVLAMIDHNEEGYAFADIDLAGAGFDNKYRPDGTELTKQRRPELYQQLTAVTNKTPQHKKSFVNITPIMTNMAIFATYTSNEKAIEDVCHYIENNLSDIIQLPELFFVTDKTIINDDEQRVQISQLSKQVIEKVSAVLRPLQYLCTSLVIEENHQAVIISEHGLIAAQSQLHFCKRYPWASFADKFNIIELPLEQGNIKLIMLTADDANIPEIVNLAALHDIHLLLIPFDIQEPCEVKYNLLSRAAENRICIVAASREKSFVNDLSLDNSHNNSYSKNKIKAQKSTGLIVNLTMDSTLLPLWKSRKFNGYHNQPLVKLQYGKITKAVIHPIAACTKQVC
jgi:predicted amidohydrolase